MSLRPYRGRFDLVHAAHLARRAAFGATPDALAAMVERGLEASVEELLADDGSVRDDNPFRVRAGENSGPARAEVVARWLFEMLHGRHPARERLALAWHGHLPVGIEKLKNPWVLDDYVGTLRAHAFGRYPDLVLAVARTPAMLRYLDNVDNVAGAPNENFARELLELFTLGLGAFDETDVREAARALTGWSYTRRRERPRFEVHPDDHDAGVKEVLGVRGRLTGDEVVRLAAEHPATAKRVAWRLWREYVADDPDEAGVAALTAAYADRDGGLRETLRALWTSEPFFASAGARVRGPVEWLVGCVRALGLGPQEPRFYESAGRRLPALGQVPLAPPNVAGWPGGAAWLGDGALMGRINLAHALARHAGAGRRDHEALALALTGRAAPRDGAARRGLSSQGGLFLLLASPDASVC